MIRPAGRLQDFVHVSVVLSPGGCVSVSGPEGPFSLRPLRDVTHLYLLAAGTGFTPMARLIQLALQDGDTIKWGLFVASEPLFLFLILLYYRERVYKPVL